MDSPVEPPAPDRGASTERRFLDSSLASYGSQAGRLLVGFVAKVILARWVIPQDYGLYDEALRLVTLAAAVRDLGLTYHLMRDRTRPYGTVFAFTVLSGLVVTGVLMLTAPLFGVLNPDLPAVLQVFGVWVLLDGLAAVPRTYFERELRIGRLVVPELARAALTALVAVGLAVAGFGVWSLVLGDLAATACYAALVGLRAWGKFGISWRLPGLSGLLRQSRYLFGIWLLVQLVTYIDIFIIEVFGETETVGQYARAYWIAFLMPLIVAPRALLPALVEYRDDLPRFREAFRLGTVFLMAFQVIAGYFLYFNAEKVVEILLGEDWEPAVALLKILCFVPFLDVFTDLGGEVLKVRHEDRAWMVIVFVNLISLVGFGTWFTARWGASGMAWANFLLLGNLIMAWRMRALLGRAFGHLMRDLATVYLAPLPLFLGVSWLPADSWLRLAASVGAAALAAALLAARHFRAFEAFFLKRSL